MRDIDDTVYEGAWRLLCVNMMFQAVQNMKRDRRLYRPGTTYRDKKLSGLDKGTLQYRAVARDWLDGGVGLVTFEDCCDTLGVDPDRARDRIVSYCHNKESMPHLS